MSECGFFLWLKSSTSHCYEFVSSDCVFAALQIHEQVLGDGMSDVLYHNYHILKVILV